MKSFGQEHREVSRFEGRASSFGDLKDAARLSIIYYPSMSLITVISSVASG